MTLNATRLWDGDVAEIQTDLPKHPESRVKNAFFQGRADKVQIETTEVLYKFNNYPVLCAPGSDDVSAWWSPYAEYEHDAGWEGRLRLAAHLHVSIRELGRLTSVVREDWNSLEYLMVIKLAVPVWGFWGTFAAMDRIDPEGVSKMKPGEGKGQSKRLPGSGGASQFYIPGLKAAHVASAVPESLLGK